MFFIGDTHGSFDRYIWLINNLMLPNGRGKGLDCSLQCGDFGIFTEKEFNKIPSMDNHRFFRGNHDNPTLCNKHPNCLGDYGYLSKQEMFWVSGGFSIDFHRRLNGVTWWDNEEIDYITLKKVMEFYADSKPKIMVSHECPSTIKAATIAKSSNFNPKLHIVSRTEMALEQMLNMHKPEIWIYGHYHSKIDTMENGVRFVGLGDHRVDFLDQLFEIPGLNW